MKSMFKGITIGLAVLFSAGSVVAAGPGLQESTVYADTVQYTVKFDANGGVGSMADQTMLSGDATFINKNTFTKDGYFFSGWVNKNDANKRLFIDGHKIDPVYQAKNPNNDKEFTLVAQWERVRNFTIHFDANGGTGTMADQVIVGGSETRVADIGFTKEGYTFGGWTINEIPDLKLNNKQLLNWARWNRECNNLTLVAQWDEAKDYTVKFDANGGTGTMANQTMKGATASVINKNTFTKSGYFFSGWINKYDASKKLFIDGHTIDAFYQAKNPDNENEIIFVAQWEKAKNFAIHFEANGGTGTMEDQIIEGGSETRVADVGFRKEDHTFGGWTVKEIPELKLNNKQLLNWARWNKDCNDLTLVAQWDRAKDYTVKFEANGGQGTMANQTMRGSVATAINKNTFTKDGYFLKGWVNKYDKDKRLFVDEHIIDSFYQAKNPDNENEIVFVAQWEPVHDVKAVFDANGGTGKMASQTLKTGSWIDLDPVKFKKDNYTFEGWRVDGDETGFLYRDKKDVDPWKIDETASSITFVAQWQPVYTLVRYTDTATGNVKDEWVPYGSETKLDNKGYTNGNTALSGWTDSAGKSYDVGTTITSSDCYVRSGAVRDIDILSKGEETDPFWTADDGSMRGVQSGVVYEKNGKKYVFATVVRTEIIDDENNKDHKAYLVVFDYETGAVIRKKRVDLVEHGNDIAYNSSNGHFYIATSVEGKGIVEVDENFNVINRNVAPAHEIAVASIGYYDHKFYVIYGGEDSGTYAYHKIDVLDENFNVLKTGDLNERGWYMAQGLYVDDKYIYTPGFLASAETGDYTESKISVFDKNTFEYKGQFGFRENIEMEDLFIEDGKLYYFSPGGRHIFLTEASMPFIDLKTNWNVEVTGVTLNKTTATIYEGDSLNLTATVNPSSASNKNVTWSSGNTAIATVSNNGLVKGVKAGTVNITVKTAAGNKTAVCKVTVQPARSGLVQDSDGIWRYYVNNKVATTFTGMVKKGSENWYVQNGIFQKSYSGLVHYNNRWWYITNGVEDKSYAGLTWYNSNWWYVSDGTLNKQYEGLTWHNNNWWYITNGTINRTYAGLTWYSSNWWYVSNGSLNKVFAGLTLYNGSWWYVKNGTLVNGFTGIVLHNGNNWYVNNKKVDKSYTGLVYYNDDWWYVENGFVNKDFKGLVYCNSKWWYISNAHIDRKYNSLTYCNGKWWYVKNGTIDKSYTGVTLYNGNYWYVVKGAVDKSYNGKVTSNGKTYNVVNGHATIA